MFLFKKESKKIKLIYSALKAKGWNVVIEKDIVVVFEKYYDRNLKGRMIEQNRLTILPTTKGSYALLNQRGVVISKVENEKELFSTLREIVVYYRPSV